LSIKEKQSPQVSIALANGNLGNLHKTRGDLGKAMEYYERSLSINEKRGDLDKAIEYYERSLSIEEKLGRQEGMVAAYTNFGIVYKTRGDLGKAIAYWEKSAVILSQLKSPHYQMVVGWIKEAKTLQKKRSKDGF